MAQQIHAFNTQRGYSKHGQRIAWTILSTGNIAMVDVDRGIDYVLVHRSDITPRDSTVLALYDANKTAPWNPAEYSEARKLEAALSEAAHSHD